MKNLKTQAKEVVFLNPRVRGLVGRLLLRGNRQFRVHPFDVSYGVDTSGTFPRQMIQTKDISSELINDYAGAQPNVTRAALAALPPIEDQSFVDLGCGKGRVVIIGSEYRFQEVIGVELSPPLARIASANVAKVRLDFGGRPPIRIIEGNALDHLPTEGNAVLYLYHAFNRQLMLECIARLEAALQASLQHLFIIYHNPVWGEVLDASPAFSRWYAESIAIDAEGDLWDNEREAVVTWQSERNARAGVHPGADRVILVVAEHQADVAP